MKNGEKIAKFISNKTLLKAVLKPLFDVFGYMAKRSMQESMEVRIA
jgi:hypothetical protein